MTYGISTRLFASERLSSRLLNRILEAGFPQIEVFAAPEHLDYRDPHHARDMGQWFNDFDVKLHSLHAPLWSEPGFGRRGGFLISVAYRERRLRIDSMDEIKRALEVAERAPFRYLVLHLGLEGEEFSLEKFDAAFTSIEHLRIFAKERGVRLLLENTASELGNPAHLIQFLNYTRLDDVGICFDAGHAHLGGGALEALGQVKDRMVTAHLHDNHGEKDEHLLPLEGALPWAELMPELAPAEAADFCAFLEPQDRGPESPQLKQVREVADKLGALESGVANRE
ncbi:MAG TPA: sugar phosphate isomerase/epimerase family protein [Terriglobia bacterium]|jgi:sugar phosphate isomerase/epimerase|nr:sugar phosphate isomerase/epimerase family protein [Terriglobia bacterium]